MKRPIVVHFRRAVRIALSIPVCHVRLRESNNRTSRLSKRDFPSIYNTFSLVTITKRFRSLNPTWREVQTITEGKNQTLSVPHCEFRVLKSVARFSICPRRLAPSRTLLPRQKYFSCRLRRRFLCSISALKKSPRKRFVGGSHGDIVPWGIVQSRKRLDYRRTQGRRILVFPRV